MPGNEILIRLRLGKDALREARRRATLEAKFLELLQAQRLFIAIVQTRRSLLPSEQPWDVLREVRDSVIVDGDSIYTNAEVGPVTSSSSSHWSAPEKLKLPSP